MRPILFLLAQLSLCINTYEQQVPNVRFIHIGEETKPIGTVVISVRGYIKPMDRPLDSIFGRNVKTDEKTFRFIIKFIKSNKYTFIAPNLPQGTTPEYKIIGPNGLKLYFISTEFFNDLRASLKQQNLDPAVIEVLKPHY
jgi:hypothetical protein